MEATYQFQMNGNDMEITPKILKNHGNFSPNVVKSMEIPSENPWKLFQKHGIWKLLGNSGTTIVS